MKVDLTTAESAMVRWALVKFAAVSEPKIAKAAMELRDKLAEIGPRRNKTR